jgi:hypothetical protein
LDRTHRYTQPFARSGKRRSRPETTPAPQRHQSIALTQEGFPAATPEALPPSSVVFVSDESRARFPWLPGRVIAGSIWLGPGQERVRVDEDGRAQL